MPHETRFQVLILPNLPWETLLGRFRRVEALGFDQASAFRHDVQYREGRQFRKSRDRRAVERMTSYGRRLLQDRWTGHEHETIDRPSFERLVAQGARAARSSESTVHPNVGP